MATERTTDIVLRAQVDKALLPLDQVLQRVKQLTTVLDQQREAAKTGDTTLGEYAKALRDVENAAKDLLRARVALNTFQDKQETLAAKQAAVATARQARDTFQSTLTAEPTKAQERQLGSLEKALQRSEAQANTASRAFEKAAAEMERMQVDINKLAATHAEITIFRDMASDALRAGTAVNDTLIATLKAAKVEKEATAQRIADREKLDAAIAKTNAGLRAEAENAAKAAALDAENKQRILSRVSAGLGDLGAKQQAADAAEAAKLREAADKKRAADEQAAEARAKALAQANAGFERLSQQEREKALAAQTAAQAAADKQRADSAQEAENKARTLAQVSAGLARQEAAEREKAIAAAAAAQQAADKQRVAEAQAAAKAEAQAEKERADLVRAVRAAETDAMRQAYKDAQAAEAAQAKERQKNAAEYQAAQARLREAVAGVWQEEAAQVEKARQGVAAFEATAAATLARVRELMAHGAAQIGAVGAPIAPTAIPLAEQLRTTLGTAPGASAGGGHLAGLQTEIAAVTASVNTGAGAVKGYADELKRLDAISREVVRQSQIIDSFQKQKQVAREAWDAFHALTEQIKALETQAKGATTPEAIAEVTSKIAEARRRLGSVEGGTGLAANARKELEALELETNALNSIGVSAARVASAMRALTDVAVSTSAERQTIAAKHKIDLDAEADAIINNARRTEAARHAAVAAAGAAPTGAVAQVTAVGGPGRGPQAIDDVVAATNRLDAAVGKSRLTAQTFNKTMDELFAIQRQIASDAMLIDNFKASEAALNAATAAYQKAKTELIQLNTAVKAGTADIRELQQAEGAFTRTSAELEKQAKAHQAIDQQLRARRINTGNLVAETDRLVQSSAKLAAVQERAQQSSGKIFGLSSYQFQNLQFQVNDVITQLSLGQGLMRTFEAQAGQIFQIFDLSAAALGRFVLIGGPAIAIILAIGASLLRLKEGVDAQREFNHQLALSADGAAYNSKSLVDLARNIEGMGVSFSDAKDATKLFVREGLNTDAMLRFSKAARDLSDATGGKFADALKQIIVIATGSRDEIMKLNEQYNFLHTAEAKAIEDSFKYGNSLEGRNVALRALTNALGKAAAEGIDPFTQAMRDLTEAWHNFLDAIASTQLFNAVAWTLRQMGEAAKLLADGMRYARDAFASNTQQVATQLDARIAELRARLERTQDFVAKLRKQGTPEEDPTLKLLTEQAVELRDKLDEARLAKYNLTQPVPGTITSPTVPTGGTAVVPESRKVVVEEIIKALKAEGFNAAAIAAVLANVQHESGFDPMLWNQEHTDYGLFQYSKSGGRYQDLAAKSGTAEPNIQQQLKYFLDDIRMGIFKPVGDMLRALPNTPEGAALGSREFTKQFERPRNASARAEERAPTSVAFFGRLGGDMAPLLDPNLTNKDEVNQQKIYADLVRQRVNAVNSLLRGDERIASDQMRLYQFFVDENEKLNSALKGRDPTPEVWEEFNAKINAKAKQLEDLRLKEIEDAQKALNDIIKAAEDAVNRANKTSAEAQRAVVDSSYEQRLEAINIQIRNGATDIIRSQLERARDALLKLRDEEREKVTIQVDRAIVDTLEKARDESIKAILDSFKTGTLTIAQMFKAIAEVTSKFAPQIKEAVERSNADLRRQPQTPAIVEQLAKNAKVDPGAAKSAADSDKSLEARRTDLLKTRSEIETTNQNLVTQGAITQVEANERIEKSYADIKPQIIALNEQLSIQIALQLKNKQIAPETYDLMKAKIEETTAAATGLTKEQKRLQEQIENVIVSAASRGFDTIAENIGKVVAGTESFSEALKNAGLAFAQFAADVLKGIAQIIIQREILAVIKLATQAAHAGGIVGSTGMTKSGISPLVFLGAPRMHNGGLAGDEVATILKRGEEVLPTNDPRHKYNLMNGKSSEVTSMPNIRQVLVMDPAQVSGALAGAHGEKVVVTHIKNNAGAIRSILNQK